MWSDRFWLDFFNAIIWIYKIVLIILIKNSIFFHLKIEHYRLKNIFKIQNKVESERYDPDLVHGAIKILKLGETIFLIHTSNYLSV